ncbi:hypothetical protein RSAG8_08956, partial [Rhizoctonia solani AG-8 WAC10335]
MHAPPLCFLDCSSLVLFVQLGVYVVPACAQLPGDSAVRKFEPEFVKTGFGWSVCPETKFIRL